MDVADTAGDFLRGVDAVVVVVVVVVVERLLGAVVVVVVVVVGAGARRRLLGGSSTSDSDSVTLLSNPPSSSSDSDTWCASLHSLSLITKPTTLNKQQRHTQRQHCANTHTTFVRPQRETTQTFGGIPANYRCNEANKRVDVEK